MTPAAAAVTAASSTDDAAESEFTNGGGDGTHPASAVSASTCRLRVSRCAPTTASTSGGKRASMNFGSDMSSLLSKFKKRSSSACRFPAPADTAASHARCSISSAVCGGAVVTCARRRAQ
eukprot:4572878-Pleurochrysis_carterae.AAC.2